jgi:phosphate/sulfate permease
MTQDGKGETSTLSVLLLAGAIGIGIWFLTVASDFVDSGTSPVYAVFFFVPICGVFLVVVVLAEIGKSLSGSSKNKPELSGEDTTSDVDGKKKEVSSKQILVSLLIAIIGIVTFLFTIDDIASFLNN